MTILEECMWLFFTVCDARPSGRQASRISQILSPCNYLLPDNWLNSNETICFGKFIAVLNTKPWNPFATHGLPWIKDKRPERSVHNFAMVENHDNGSLDSSALPNHIYRKNFLHALYLISNCRAIHLLFFEVQKSQSEGSLQFLKMKKQILCQFWSEPSVWTRHATRSLRHSNRKGVTWQGQYERGDCMFPSLPKM